MTKPAKSVAYPPCNIPETDLTFSTSDGLSIVVPAAEVAQDRAAMTATSDALDKWLRSEPGISARFGAPKCYEAKGPHRELLTDYLSSIHKYSAENVKFKVELANLEKNQGDPSTIHRKKMELRTSTQIIGRAVQQVIDNLRRYYMEKQADGTRNPPTKPSPMDRIHDLRKALEKYKPEQWTSDEYSQAQVMVKILHSCEVHGLRLMRELEAVILAKSAALPAAGTRPQNEGAKPSEPVTLTKEQVAQMQADLDLQRQTESQAQALAHLAAIKGA